MKGCDACGEARRRRKRCWHCGFFVCTWCWHHEHACEPGHSKAECEDLKRLDQVRRLGGGEKAARQYLDRLRILALAAEESKHRKEVMPPEGEYLQRAQPA